MRRLKGLRDCERGDFAPTLLVLVVTVLLVIGFTVDAGRLLSARREVNDVASQAATAGAQAVIETQVLGGRVLLGEEAVAAAQAYLAAVGVEGSASVEGDTVVVVTSTDWEPVMFGAIFGSKQLSGTGTARAVRGVNDAET